MNDNYDFTFTALNLSKIGGAQQYIRDFTNVSYYLKQSFCIISSSKAHIPYGKDNQFSCLSSLTSPVITRSKLFILIYGLYIFTCLFFYSVRFRPRIIYCVGIYPIVCVPPMAFNTTESIRPYGSDIQRDKVLNYISIILY